MKIYAKFVGNIVITLFLLQPLLALTRNGNFQLRSNSMRLKDSLPIIDVDEYKDLKDLKYDLLRLAARTSRGEFADEYEKELAISIASQIESRNAVRNLDSTKKLIEGNWELVLSSTYLFRSSPFFMAARAVCKEGAEAERFNWFCKQHREALAFTTIGAVRQSISTSQLVSEFESNVAAVSGLPLIIKGTLFQLSASIAALTFIQ